MSLWAQTEFDIKKKNYLDYAKYVLFIFVLPVLTREGKQVSAHVPATVMAWDDPPGVLGGKDLMPNPCLARRMLWLFNYACAESRRGELRYECHVRIPSTDAWMENAFWFTLNEHLVTDKPGKHRLQMFVACPPLPTTSSLSRKSPPSKSSFPPHHRGFLTITEGGTVPHRQ